MIKSRFLGVTDKRLIYQCVQKENRFEEEYSLFYSVVYVFIYFGLPKFEVESFSKHAPVLPLKSLFMLQKSGTVSKNTLVFSLFIEEIISKLMGIQTPSQQKTNV